MPSPKRAALAAAMLLAGLACARLAAFPRGSTQPAASTTSATLKVGGRTRSYLLHLPPGYDHVSSLPLVLVLHGGTQSPESAEGMSGLSRKADAEHFIAVYPRGTGKLPTWNAGNCCAYAMENHVDDVAFLHALLDKIEREFPLNPRRIYVTGISNGAMMSYRVACELADKVAAIAPVEGALNVDCHPSAPVSVLIFHGTADRLVPYEGGTTPFQIGPKRTDNSVAAAVSFWMKNDGCSPTPRQEKLTEARVDTYSGCTAGAAVQLYTIQGGRHMWPGVAISGNHVAATDIMWSFFAQHPKP